MVFAIIFLLSSCTIMEPLSDAYETDEAYWQPGEKFGRPEFVAGGQLAKPQSDGEDFYSEDAARRNSYAPSYLDSSQTNQTEGMVPVWDPVLGWRMVYDPNAVSSNSWGNSSFNSPWSSPYSNFGGYGGYGGYGSNSSWMLGLGMQTIPYWGNGMYGNGYYPYSSYNPYSMYSPYSSYGSYMPYGSGYNPYGWNNGGFYNPYYWNGNYGGNTGGSADQVISAARPSGTVSTTPSSHPVIHRRPKSLGTSGVPPHRKQTISEVFTTTPSVPAPVQNQQRPSQRTQVRPNQQPASVSRPVQTERPRAQPQVRQEVSRPAPAPSVSRPSNSGSSSSPSRSSGNSGTTRSSGKRP